MTPRLDARSRRGEESLAGRSEARPHPGKQSPWTDIGNHSTLERMKPIHFLIVVLAGFAGLTGCSSPQQMPNLGRSIRQSVKPQVPNEFGNNKMTPDFNNQGPSMPSFNPLGGSDSGPLNPDLSPRTQALGNALSN